MLKSVPTTASPGDLGKRVYPERPTTPGKERGLSLGHVLSHLEVSVHLFSQHHCARQQRESPIPHARERTPSCSLVTPHSQQANNELGAKRKPSHFHCRACPTAVQRQWLAGDTGQEDGLPLPPGLGFHRLQTESHNSDATPFGLINK